MTPRRHSSYPTVTIVYRWLPRYRVSFYAQLRTIFAEHGIRLRLMVGQPDRLLAERNDEGRLDWAEVVNNRYFSVPGGRQLVWQPVLHRLHGSDLVVVEQASRLLLNYLLFAWRRVGGPKVGVWGHGLNLDEENASALGEAVKRKLASSADWWFCYTDSTASLVRELGVCPERLTVVQNATDTSELRHRRAHVVEPDLVDLRSELGLTGQHVALYLGSLYPRKRLEFLIEACDVVRRLVNDFELVVVGDGPQRNLVLDAVRSRPWLHYVGVRRDEELARLGAVARVVLNPGLVGLSILDGFALGLPMITCELPYHSPEIDYLIDGHNGIILPRDVAPQGYAEAVRAVLTDKVQLSNLAAAAIASAQTNTIQVMAERFAEGAISAIGLANNANGIG